MREHERIAAILHTKNEAPVELDASRTALVVVDMQRYFTEPSHPFMDVIDALSPNATSGYLKRVRDTVIPNIARLLARCRDAGSLVIFTGIGSETGDGGDLPGRLRGFDELGTGVIGRRIWPRVTDASWEIDDAVAPRPGELVVNKRSAGAFATTHLEDHLRRHAIDAVVVTGVVTDVCVSTTAREAADRGFDVVVVSDACTTLSEQLHQANLESLKVFGAARTTDDVLALMDASRTAADQR
jgi:biuret amidohydrolase